MQNVQCGWEPFALLLIDVQRDFWPERMEARFPAFPANVTRLLALCRDEGLEVVHLRACFQPDRSDWMPKYRLRGRIPCVARTVGAGTLTCAIEQPGEMVLVKQTFDGFHTPDLLTYLHKRNKRFLLTAGLVTSTCVLLTTVSAMQLGFLTAVVEDCCADEPNAHQDTLERYQFLFDRVTVEGIVERHSAWSGAVGELARWESAA
ncbi:MAG: cysteine hydrolase [Chloroflexi bacterium AL-W]|nr:cysteine hydrolase [Chloroflexi bacterium AL-N1]NOK65907.1 cysteine hydrolase [Chloroflexi bacterium AL-N10]NOK72788.1 cysteine hydrolase [Chloroflexi bacterium AL-N5]NOK79685.1 cysteine hydrolase [Chloroflexi bacterium AL-W]NOK93010.1 cysteine hydrolase [Chloroflexi bacterium AL-N15]